MKKYILFDLDGTLTDPGLGITNSIMYALDKLQTPYNSREELYKFIGPPLMESFENEYGYSKEKSRLALDLYREYFSVKGLFENEVYGGIPEMLDRLRENGAQLIVATSKPEPYSVRILEHFALAGKFLFIAGNDMEETRSTKHSVIEYALSSCGITDRAACIMVGDRMHDVIGAKQSGLESVGVLYGYGSYDELESAGADHIAADVRELEEVLMSA